MERFSEYKKGFDLDLTRSWYKKDSKTVDSEKESTLERSSHLAFSTPPLSPLQTRYEDIELVPLKTSTFTSPLPSSLVFPLSMSVPFTSSSEASSGQQLSVADLLLSSQNNSPSEKEITAAQEEEGEEMIFSIKTLDYKSMNLILHPTGKLLLLSAWRDPSWTSAASVQDGLTSDEVELRRTMFGTNLIDVVGASTWDIFIIEATHPFYIFSLLSIALWSYDDYG